MNDLLDRLAERSITQVTGRSAEIGDCLVWTGSRDRKGYGWIAVARKAHRVHRVAWIARHGQPPPETPCVLHHCDNPPCWRDEHLFVGTRGDNNRDTAAKGRHHRYNIRKTHCPQNHPYDETNTYEYRGRRYCRACIARRARRRRAR